MGQTEPCYIYRLITKGTAEEKVHKRQVMKELVSAHILDGKKIDRKFSKAEVKEMLDISGIRPPLRKISAINESASDIDPILNELVKRSLLYDWELYEAHMIKDSIKSIKPNALEQCQNDRVPRRTIVSIKSKYLHQ